MSLHIRPAVKDPTLLSNDASTQLAFVQCHRLRCFDIVVGRFNNLVARSTFPTTCFVGGPTFDIAPCTVSMSLHTAPASIVIAMFTGGIYVYIERLSDVQYRGSLLQSKCARWVRRRGAWRVVFVFVLLCRRRTPRASCCVCVCHFNVLSLRVRRLATGLRRWPVSGVAEAGAPTGSLGPTAQRRSDSHPGNIYNGDSHSQLLQASAPTRGRVKD